MAIKTFNPTTPSRRNMTVLSYKGLSKVKPEKSPAGVFVKVRLCRTFTPLPAP